MSLGTLVLELQGNLARTQEDMGRMNQIVEATMARIDQAAARSSRNIQNVAASTRTIQRVEGADQVVKDLARVEHGSTGARREMLVLAHELSQGNFKRAAGSVMVLGERLDWMGKIMSPVGATIGAVAIAIAVFAIAAIKGAAESREFANSIILTGNYAGLTEGRYNAMASRISTASGVTIAASREITQELISTGRFGSAALEGVAQSAAKFAEVSGQKSEEVVKFYEKMSGGVLKWAVDANKQYHFLDGALFDHIKALEEQGKADEAELIASKALYDHLGNEAVANVGFLTEAYRYLAKTISGAKEEALAFGRAATPENSLAALQVEAARIRGAQAGAGGGMNADLYAQQLDAVNKSIGQVTHTKRSQEDNADLTASKKAHDDKVVEAKEYWSKLTEAHHTGAENLAAELDKIAREGAVAGAAPEDIKKEQDRVRKEYAGKNTGGGNIARADLQSQLKPMQDQIAAEDKLLANRESVLSKYYKSDEISIQAYYDTRRTVIVANLARVKTLYDQEIAAQESFSARSKGAAKIEAQTKASGLRDAEQQAVTKSGEQLAALTLEQKNDTEAYANEVQKLSTELNKLNRTQGNSAGAEFDRSHQKLTSQATAGGDTGSLNTLAQARSAAVAQAEMTQLKEQATVITEALGTVEKRVMLDEQTGQKLTFTGMLELAKARTEAAQQLDVLAGKMTAVAANSGMPALITNAQQFKLQVDQVSASTDVVGKSITDTFANGFAKTLDNTINRTKTLKQSFLDMGNSIEQSIEQMVSKDLANTLFGIGSSSGGAGWMQQIIGIGIGMLGGDASASAGVQVGGAMDMSMPVAGALASGGPAGAGGLYQVNERGPELLTVANKTFLMMGDQPGSVTPTGSSKGSANTFNMQIAVPAGTTRQTAQQQASEIMRHANIAMARNS